LSLINIAPSSFDGTLNELYERWSKHVQLNLPVIEEFHKNFCAYYLKSADPLFLVRNVADQERGLTMRTESGAQLRPTDNAPAWWIHFQLFSGQYRQYPLYSTFIKSIPCHRNDVNLPVHINRAKWHVAHIFNAKDRNVDFYKWDRKELLRRTARNIHPCNYFYIPLTDWQKHGGDPIVISFFYEKFKSLYWPIWDEFLELVDGIPPYHSIEADEYPYTITAGGKKERSTPKPNKNPLPIFQGNNLHNKTDDCIVKYSYSRLTFNADLIEQMALEDRFCIVTNEGVFAMTKREFYETFQSVVESISYRKGRLYNYRQVPQKAMRFKVG